MGTECSSSMAPSPLTTLESGTHTVHILMEGFKKRSPEEPLGFYDLEVNDFHAFIHGESMLLKEYWLFSSVIYGVSLLLEFANFG